jgi:hypothetical protein
MLIHYGLVWSIEVRRRRWSRNLLGVIYMLIHYGLVRSIEVRRRRWSRNLLGAIYMLIRYGLVWSIEVRRRVAVIGYRGKTGHHTGS